MRPGVVSRGALGSPGQQHFGEALRIGHKKTRLFRGGRVRSDQRAIKNPLGAGASITNSCLP
jgi:hypothetical protein